MQAGAVLGGVGWGGWGPGGGAGAERGQAPVVLALAGLFTRKRTEDDFPWTIPLAPNVQSLKKKKKSETPETGRMCKNRSGSH